MEDFLDLIYRLYGIFLSIFFVGGVRLVIINCQEVSGTAQGVLLVVVDERVQGIS